MGRTARPAAAGAPISCLHGQLPRVCGIVADVEPPLLSIEGMDPWFQAGRFTTTKTSPAVARQTTRPGRSALILAFALCTACVSYAADGLAWSVTTSGETQEDRTQEDRPPQEDQDRREKPQGEAESDSGAPAPDDHASDSLAPSVPSTPSVPGAPSAPGAPNALQADGDDATPPVLTHRLPPNMRMPANLRPLLERVLERSATFRKQVDRIAKARNVRIDISYGGLRGDRLYHALSVVRKHEWGAIFVKTQLFVPADMVEIMAHEMEHVCEQIEGVDIRGLARSRHPGVYDLNGHYETMRAIVAGQRVTREYQGLPPDAPLTRAAY